MMGKETIKSGGIQSRIGRKFYEEITKIQDARLINGKSKDRVSMERITNIIVRHKTSWEKIVKDIIEADEEEINKYGK